MMNILNKGLQKNKRIGYWIYITQLKWRFSKQKRFQIESLNEIISNYKKQDSRDIIQALKTQTSPSQIYLNIVRAIKQNLFYDTHKKQVIISILKSYSLQQQYLKHLVSLLLPINYQFEELNQIYIILAINYIKITKKPTIQNIFYMICNIQRTVFDQFLQWGDQHWLVKDYSLEQQLCQLLIKNIINLRQEFDNLFLIRFMKLCSVLNVYEPEYSQILINLLYNNQSRFKLKQILEILCYLSDNKCFPYQYFYPRCSLWSKTIKSYPKFSSKKSLETLKYLDIIIKQSPCHSQKIIYQIIQLMQENTLSLDNQELTRQWYMISKTKFIFPQTLIQKMIYKINQSVKSMKLQQLSLLVRGFAHYNKKLLQNKGIDTILRKIQKIIPENRSYEKMIIQNMIQLY